MWGILLSVIALYQAQANYQIQATVDFQNWSLQGQETITFVNLTPDTIQDLWLLLYINAFKDGSALFRESQEWFGSYEHLKPKDQGDLRISELELQGQKRSFDSLGTMLHLPLAEPVMPGETLTFFLRFEAKIPKLWSRTGHQGNYVNLVHWYPKLAAYDSLGWHPIDYHVWGEFYANFGHYDVTLTFPQNVIAGFTGTLVEGKGYQAFLDSLMAFDPESLAVSRRKAKPDTTTFTIRFVADSVHDVAVVLSPDFVPLKQTVDQTEIWTLVRARHLQRYLKIREDIPKILEQFNRWFGPYPYKKLTIVDGSIGRAGGGMEYPQLVIIGSGGRRGGGFMMPKAIRRLGLIDVIAHEVGHQWFYGIFGNNEMDEAWLDEAFASYAESRFMDWRFPKDSIPQLLGWTRWWLPKDRSPLKFFREMGLYRTLNGPWHAPIGGQPAYKMNNYGTLVYSKGERVIEMLGLVVGQETLDSIFHTYYRTWRFRNPHIRDFQKVCEQVSGQDLDWFFRQWLYTDWTADYAIHKVEKTDRGVRVQVENRGDIEMTIDVRVVTPEGPVTKRLERGKRRLLFPGITQVKQVILDPDDVIPEPDEWNNTRPRRFAIRPLIAFPEPGVYTLTITPIPLYWPKEGARFLLRLGGSEGGFRHKLDALMGYAWGLRRPLGALKWTEPLDRLRASWGIAFGEWAGARSLNLFWSHTWRKTPYDPRPKTFALSLILWDVYDSTLSFDPALYPLGQWGEWFGRYTTRHRSRLGRMSVTWFGGIGATSENLGYAKLGLRIQATWTTRWPVHVLLDARKIWGTAPSQALYRLKGPIFLPWPWDLAVPHRGDFSVTNRHWTWGDGVRTAPIELAGTARIFGQIQIPLRWVRAYAEAGWLWNGDRAETAYDLGISKKFGLLEVAVPLWPKEAREVGWVLTLRL